MATDLRNLQFSSLQLRDSHNRPAQGKVQYLYNVKRLDQCLFPKSVYVLLCATPHAKFQSQTPSPFRLSRRQPSTGRSAGPQFAASPRFLLSQSTRQKKDDVEIDDDDDDDDELPSTAPGAHTSARPQSAIHPGRQRDALEVSDDGDLRNDTAQGSARHELADDEIDSTPPGEPESSGPLDAEFDALFAPVRDGHKRRRLSAGEHQGPKERLNRDSDILPSSPDQVHQHMPRTPAPRPVTSATPRAASMQATPSLSARPIPPALSTPRNTKTPFRSKPRFMLSARKPPNSQAPLAADPSGASQPTSPPERRRPAFILPRSPSPDAAAEDIPAPFSPSSRTLRRRGKRLGLPDYAPGGMAAEVRSWILEMGSKRENAIPSRTNADATDVTNQDLSRYLVAARVLGASQTAMNSSGALGFILAAPVNDSSNVGQESEVINILAMGPPRTKPESRQVSTRFSGIQTVPIHVGDLVGIYRGLTWEVDLDEFQTLGASNRIPLDSLSDQRTDDEKQKQRWLVAMEWDLMQGAT